MNTMGLRQKALVAVLAVVALYGLAVALWFTTCEASWKSSRRAYEKAKSEYAKECRTIAQKNKWRDDYETAKKSMPFFSVEQATDTTWLKVVGNVAETNRIEISQLNNGKETQAGEVYELEVLGNGWEGSLEALVRFLYELENSEKGMFDIKSISVKPNSAKKGYLKGSSFVVSCAYMREEGK